MRHVSTSFLLVIVALGILADIDTKTSSNQQAIEGANTTLVCTFTPQDGIDITWSIDDGYHGYYGTQLISRSVVVNQRFGLVNQASLFISNVRRSDSGTYICSIYSSIERRSVASSVQLNVLWIQMPIVGLPGTPVVEGDVVTLVCSVVADPAATYKWCRQGYEIQSNHLRYVQSSKTGLLTINHAGYEDHTSFTCTASNVAGSKTSDEVILNVQYSPRFTLRKEGNVIRCIPYGNPMIEQVLYYINGSRQPNVEQVTIDERFCHTFTCAGVNTVGEGNRTEIYCPKVKYSPEKPDDLGNQTLVGVLTSVLIFLILSAVMLVVYGVLRPGPGFEQEEGRYDDLFTDGPSSV